MAGTVIPSRMAYECSRAGHPEGPGFRITRKGGQGVAVTAESHAIRGFPPADAYTDLVEREGMLARESGRRTEPFPYTERHLQCCWYDPAWRPKGLRSSEAESVRVEHPGEWNLEAGPDFLNAVLVVGPERRRLIGDVEVHVRPDDWRRHGHARDPAYARVVAHVTYFEGSLPPGDLPPGAVQMALRGARHRQPSFSFDNIDVTAYPHSAPPPPPAPCHRILAAWSPRERAAFLEAAGAERLRVKTERVAAALRERDDEQVFYEEIMASLGYKRNPMAFRELARRLPVALLRNLSGGDVKAAYAILMGVAGLLPETWSPGWDTETRVFIRSLWNVWWRLRSRLERQRLPVRAWTLSGLRPQNHPHRRLAAAAGLFAGTPSPLPALRAFDPHAPAAWFRSAARRLHANPSITYWDTRLTLGGTHQKRPSALLGPPRMAAMLSNAVIPVLAATGTPVNDLLTALPAEQENILMRRAAHTLFGLDDHPAWRHTGLRQQGLMQVFLDFCIGRRSRCRDCGLVRSLDRFSISDGASRRS